jgi:hypothetical protein
MFERSTIRFRIHHTFVEFDSLTLGKGISGMMLSSFHAWTLLVIVSMIRQPDQFRLQTLCCANKFFIHAARLTVNDPISFQMECSSRPMLRVSFRHMPV